MRRLRRRRQRQAAEVARLFVALDAAAGSRGGAAPTDFVAQSHKRLRPGAALLGFRSAA